MLDYNKSNYQIIPSALSLLTRSNMINKMADRASQPVDIFLLRLYSYCHYCLSVSLTYWFGISSSIRISITLFLLILLCDVRTGGRSQYLLANFSRGCQHLNRAVPNVTETVNDELYIIWMELKADRSTYFTGIFKEWLKRLSIADVQIENLAQNFPKVILKHPAITYSKKDEVFLVLS
jgi:hypothetical protein